MDEKFEVFISFKSTSKANTSTVDFAIAEGIYTYLKQLGISVFFSNKEITESSFTNAIYDALEGTKILLIVGTTKEFLESKWIKKEYETFFSLKSNPQVFCITGAYIDLPSYLKSVQTLIYHEKDFTSKLLLICKKNGIEILPGISSVNELSISIPSSQKKPRNLWIVLITGLLIAISIYIYLRSKSENPSHNISLKIVSADNTTLKSRPITIEKEGDEFHTLTDSNGEINLDDIPQNWLEDSVTVTINDTGHLANERQHRILLKTTNTIIVAPQADYSEQENTVSSGQSKQVGSPSIPVSQIPKLESPLCDLSNLKFIEQNQMSDRFEIGKVEKNKAFFNCKSGIYEASGMLWVTKNLLIISQEDATGEFIISPKCDTISGYINFSASNYASAKVKKLTFIKDSY